MFSLKCSFFNLYFNSDFFNKSRIWNKNNIVIYRAKKITVTKKLSTTVEYCSIHHITWAIWDWERRPGKSYYSSKRKFGSHKKKLSGFDKMDIVKKFVQLWWNVQQSDWTSHTRFGLQYVTCYILQKQQKKQVPHSNTNPYHRRMHRAFSPIFCPKATGRADEV